ncbi:hypothetical protein EE548_22975 [Salmonella enterica]|nr:hypothetical protein [Salmonella enterica]EJS7092500.1 hypothetical protein [Salmonella enterica]
MNITIILLTLLIDIVFIYGAYVLIKKALNHNLYGVWYKRIFKIGLLFMLAMLISNIMGGEAVKTAAKSFFIYIDCVIAFILMTVAHASFSKLKSLKRKTKSI